MKRTRVSPEALLNSSSSLFLVFPRKLYGFGVSRLSSLLTVHFIKLIGFRNRLMVPVNRVCDYLLAESAIRLILPENERAKQEEESDRSVQENHRIGG